MTLIRQNCSRRKARAQLLTMIHLARFMPVLEPLLAVSAGSFSSAATLSSSCSSSSMTSAFRALQQTAVYGSYQTCEISIQKAQRICMTTVDKTTTVSLDVLPHSHTPMCSMGVITTKLTDLLRRASFGAAPASSVVGSASVPSADSTGLL